MLSTGQTEREREREAGGQQNETPNWRRPHLLSASNTSRRGALIDSGGPVDRLFAPINQGAATMKRLWGALEVGRESGQRATCGGEYSTEISRICVTKRAPSCCCCSIFLQFDRTPPPNGPRRPSNLFVAPRPASSWPSRRSAQRDTATNYVIIITSAGGLSSSGARPAGATGGRRSWIPWAPGPLFQRRTRNQLPAAGRPVEFSSKLTTSQWSCSDYTHAFKFKQQPVCPAGHLLRR